MARWCFRMSSDGNQRALNAIVLGRGLTSKIARKLAATIRRSASLVAVGWAVEARTALMALDLYSSACAILERWRLDRAYIAKRIAEDAGDWSVEVIRKTRF